MPDITADMREKARGAKRVVPPASTILKVIRRYCWECVGGSYVEVERCICRTCLLFPYRMGRDGFAHPEKYDLDGGEGYLDTPRDTTEENA